MTEANMNNNPDPIEIFPVEPTFDRALNGMGHDETVRETVLGTTDGWQVIQRVGTAQALHHSSTDLSEPTVISYEVTHRAVVLGSTQPVEVLDQEAVDSAGLEVARRRSGGGYVVLIPGEFMWVDVIIPRQDARSVDDVEQATWWLGAAFESWLTELGMLGEWTMHDRGVSDPELGRLVCFAAAGPGELFLDGEKVIGISQHRNKYRVRFQCMAYTHFRGDLEADLLHADRVDNLDVDTGGLAAKLRSHVREIPTQWGNVDQIGFDLIPHLNK